MKLLFVVQRYGREIAGGAEQHCRLFATRLAQRGHEVSVISSCAVSYVDWDNVYTPGIEDIDGVEVHRLPVARSRDPRLFAGVQGRVVAKARPWAPPFLQREWMRLQGPWIPDLPDEVAEVSSRCDVTIFFTYLYFTSYAGLPAARSATILHPTAHVEPPIMLPLFDLVFRLPDGFAFSTEEEADFVRRRFRLHKPCRVIGIGTDLDVRGGDVAAFRERSGIGDRPYVVYLGRTDPGKGAMELADFFIAYKQRNPGPLTLAFVGEEVHRVPRHPDIVMTGFVDDDVRHAALEGALALVQPSYFESFSMVLAEAWAASVPTLVQSHSPVLAGHCRRSGGGIPYRGFAQFEAGLQLLEQRPELRRAMGERGRRYIAENYSWDRVMQRYEGFLHRMAEGVVRPAELVV